MKLHILNDLHIEFEDFEPPATNADVVILSGDIGVGMEGLHWAEKRFPHNPVIYIAGNHEFYKHDIALINELKACAKPPIHVLDDDQVIINGVRFLGCTLWTDFRLFGEADRFYAKKHAQRNMSDYEVTKNEGKRFHPDDAQALHEASRQWLKAMLSMPFDGKTVVVTHHAPSSQSVAPRFARNLLTPSFASNLELLMDESRIALWCHGHMHESFDYEVYGTRVICNPRGYAPFALNRKFRPDLVVEI